MESLIHADIFFFISTIALVVLSIGVLIVIIYLIRILHNVREVSQRVREEGDEIVGDIRSFRMALREEGLKWKIVVGLIRGFFTAPLTSRKKPKPKTQVKEVGDN